MIDPLAPAPGEGEQLARAFLSALRDASLIVFDRELRVVRVEGRSFAVHGLDRSELPGRPLRGSIVPEAVWETLGPLYEGALRGETRSLDYTTRNGNTHYWLHASPLIAGGEVTGGVLVCQDVTERVNAETESRRLAAIVESSTDGIVSLDTSNIITSWNRGAERLYGYTAEEACGQNISLIRPPDYEEDAAEVWGHLADGHSFENHETRRVRRDGRLIDVSLTVSPILGEDGRITGASAIARDIGERKQIDARLVHQAEHDSLTGLVNRVRFERELTERIGADVTRAGALILVDIDHFKFVNDSLGHAAGDQVLRRAAVVLRRCVRRGDVVARLGGDEFAVLLLDVTSAEAEAIGAELLTALRTAPGHAVTASAGIAPFAPGKTSPEQLMISADLALYDAKEMGRDRACTASAAKNGALTWVERIRDALAHDRFVVYAQPQLALASGRIEREELLVRMLDDNGEVIPPGSFLPTAERFGLIPQIDRLVTRRGLRIAASGRSVAINLSARCIGDRDFTRWVESEMSSVGVDPEKVSFEITETAAVTQLDEARAFVERLVRLGCTCALDDFGTGFSSFTHLKYLPVNYLKIDMEFIRGLPTSLMDQRLVKSIVDIAQGLGMRTVAEGVEDAATLRILEAYGVDYAQGYHIARPAPVDEAG